MEFVEAIGRIAQNYGPGAAVAAVVAILLFRYFMAKQQAKNRTTREDFEALLEQVRATSRETESIKTELTRHSRLAQQQKCEKYHLDLLAALGKLKFWLIARASAIVEQSPGLATRSQAVAGAEAFHDVQLLAVTAAGYLSKNSALALEELVGVEWRIEHDGANAIEHVESVLRLAEQAYENVLAEARSVLVSNARFPTN